MMVILITVMLRILCLFMMPARCAVTINDGACDRDASPPPLPHREERVDSLNVRPLTSVTGQSVTASLAVTWTPPHCSLQLLGAVQVTVTALDDAAQLQVCHLLDFTSVSPDQWGTQCVLVYNLMLPSLSEGSMNWHVEVRSVPTVGMGSFTRFVSSAFVVTPRLRPASSGSQCRVNIVVLPFQDIIQVSLTRVDTSQTSMTSFHVILYACDADDCCPLCSSLRQEKEYPPVAVSLDQTATFKSVVPGFYRVFVESGSDADIVCGISPVINVTPPVPASVTASSNDTTFSQSSFLHEDVPSPDSSQYLITVVVVAVAVCVCALVVAVAVTLCYRNRRKARSLSIAEDVSCMERMISSKSTSQRETRANMVHSETSTNTPQSATSYSHATPTYKSQYQEGRQITAIQKTGAQLSPPVQLFLVAHSAFGSHVLATDSLAVYLQAFCACDVTYFRWQMNDVRDRGAEAWAAEQLDKAQCVIVVHSLHTQAVYDGWKMGSGAPSGNAEVSEKILFAALEWIARESVNPAQSRIFRVTFGSDFLSEATQCFQLMAKNSTEHGEGISTATPTSTTKLNKKGSDSGRVYRLMNDFSQLIADLHRLPNDPQAFRGRNPQLPIDSDHLSTDEGRQLYKAVASLRGSTDKNRGGKFDSQLVKESGDDSCECPDCTHKVTPCHQVLQKQDSGFADYCTGSDFSHAAFEDQRSAIFLGPEDTWAEVASDVTSLGDAFRAVNACYDRAMTETHDKRSCDCYTIGDRCL